MNFAGFNLEVDNSKHIRHIKAWVTGAQLARLGGNLIRLTDLTLPP
jgi:hypothetical protein